MDGFKQFDNSKPKPSKVRKKVKRSFSLPPTSIEYLLALHHTKSTYTCMACKEKRGKHQQKRGYGAFVHRELLRYKSGFSTVV